MLARLNRFLSKNQSLLSKIPSFSNQPFSSSQFAHHFPSTSIPSTYPQPLATNTFSLLNHHRSFSTNQGASGGNNGEDTWKFAAESDDKDSIFELEEVETKPGGVISPWDEEIVAKEGGGDVVWETSEGYKPWTMGDDDDDEKRDFFGVGEDAGAMEGFEGEGVGELEKERNEEEEKLQQREQELLATINGN